ncbi:MAG: ribulose-phosphate 3-epimerase [Candidatus Marinimicrobia bacterium]|nr:ribulose-phosphate 3-epimerase [Candidatus Neomarinimicrobiota bacterium]MCF7829850.1 ribulose-phosphate 3-epimerase [Candidatus Neomarinimicrobiota bacterium]MCF7882478.1 ribulose-phosphate 3-epimerase [Candidatus Neomarinimicrobiota bacterium]
MKKKVIPSLLSADFSKLAQEIKSVESQGADCLHLDVMDGHFVPNLTFGPMIVEAVRRITDSYLEAHLMMENPSDFIPRFADAGVNTIMIQQETCPHLHMDLERIRDAGARPGVVLNPGTPIETIAEVLPYIDQILIMTVNPGFGGQSFIESMLDKISRTKQMIGNRDIILEIDGGVDLTTIEPARDAGADYFVVGSSIFGESDPGQSYTELSQKLGRIA